MDLYHAEYTTETYITGKSGISQERKFYYSDDPNKVLECVLSSERPVIDLIYLYRISGDKQVLYVALKYDGGVFITPEFGKEQEDDWFDVKSL